MDIGVLWRSLGTASIAIKAHAGRLKVMVHCHRANTGLLSEVPVVSSPALRQKHRPPGTNTNTARRSGVMNGLHSTGMIEVSMTVHGNVVPAGLQVCPCRPAVMMLSVRLLMHIYQGVLLSLRLNADVLVIGASGSCCAERAFTSITSGYTVFTTLTD